MTPAMFCAVVILSEAKNLAPNQTLRYAQG
jgi:hypothetical protein